MLYNEKGAVKHLKVATAAMQCDHDPVKNRRKIADTVDAIMQTHPDTQLVVFGEMILGWYNPGGEAEYHRRISETIPGETTQALSGLAGKYRIYLSFGISEIKDGALFNAQVLLNPQGEIQAIHRKRNLKPGWLSAGVNTRDSDGHPGYQGGYDHLLRCCQLQDDTDTDEAACRPHHPKPGR